VMLPAALYIVTRRSRPPEPASGPDV
jgi:hypothetical protein